MPSFKKLIILALFASVGLVFLQASWLVHEWRNDREVIQRQATTALKEAVHQELENRKDSLRRYLKEILNDTTLFTFSTLYLPKYKAWSVKMADAKNPQDFTNWTNAKLPVGPVLTPQLKQDVINTMVNEQVNSNTIMYYTQKLGSRWKAKYDSLRLNDAALKNLFARKLEAEKLSPSFTLRYADTSARKAFAPGVAGKISTSAVGIEYNTIWDYDHKHVVVADINNPFLLLLKRLWFTITASFLLLMLTLYCMFRMYRVIRQQKQLAAIKNDFISNITHELKTPLATVAAAIDALQHFNGWNDAARREKYLNTSRHEINRLNALLSQIMDTAIYDKEGFSLQKEWINIKDLLNQMATALSIQYDVELNYNITAHTNREQVFADRNHFTCTIKNILENAIKYHPSRKELKIDIGIFEKDAQLAIEIKDNGAGISPEHQPFLFDKFYRAPQNGHNIKGFGLGLHYARRIMHAHNGNVSLFSQENAGTTVLLQLPLHGPA